MIDIKVNFYKYDDLWNAGVEQLSLSENSVNTLKRNGIRTIGDLVDRFEKIEGIKNLGKKKLAEIHTKLFDTYVNYLEQNGYTDALDNLFIVEQKKEAV